MLLLGAEIVPLTLINALCNKIISQKIENYVKRGEILNGRGLHNYPKEILLYCGVVEIYAFNTKAFKI
jgi:hypothetical protein